MLANLRYEFDGPVMIASLSGDVDMSNADDVGNALMRALHNETLALVLDLSEVDYFDSAGIHMLYDLRERLGVRGQALSIVVPETSRVRDSLELAAVLQAIEAKATLDEARASLDVG